MVKKIAKLVLSNNHSLYLINDINLLIQINLSKPNTSKIESWKHRTLNKIVLEILTCINLSKPNTNKMKSWKHRTLNKIVLEILTCINQSPVY